MVLGINASTNEFEGEGDKIQPITEPSEREEKPQF